MMSTNLTTVNLLKPYVLLPPSGVYIGLKGIAQLILTDRAAFPSTELKRKYPKRQPIFAHTQLC